MNEWRDGWLEARKLVKEQVKEAEHMKTFLSASVSFSTFFTSYR